MSEHKLCWGGQSNSSTGSLFPLAKTTVLQNEDAHQRQRREPAACASEREDRTQNLSLRVSSLAHLLFQSDIDDDDDDDDLMAIFVRPSYEYFEATTTLPSVRPFSHSHPNSCSSHPSASALLRLCQASTSTSSYSCIRPPLFCVWERKSLSFNMQQQRRFFGRALG